MKDHVEIGHLTKYDGSGVNRDQVMDLEYASKSIQTSLILRQRPPKPYKLLINFFISFVTTVKCRHANLYMYYLKEAEMKIALFAHFNPLTVPPVTAWTNLDISSTSDVITFDQIWHHLYSTSAGGKDLSNDAPFSSPEPTILLACGRNRELWGARRSDAGGSR